jgi:hypothetical protein
VGMKRARTFAARSFSASRSSLPIGCVGEEISHSVARFDKRTTATA